MSDRRQHQVASGYPWNPALEVEIGQRQLLDSLLTAKPLEIVGQSGCDWIKFLTTRPFASSASACPDFVISRSPVQVGSPAPKILRTIGDPLSPQAVPIA